MTDIREEILDLIVKKTGVERKKLISDIKIVDLQITSIDMLDIIFDLEEKYQIEIPPNTNDLKMETLDQFIDMIAQLTKQTDKA